METDSPLGLQETPSKPVSHKVNAPNPHHSGCMYVKFYQDLLKCSHFLAALLCPAMQMTTAQIFFPYDDWDSWRERLDLCSQVRHL